MYTEEYDTDAVLKLAGQDSNKRILIPIGLYTVADKYDVARLFPVVTRDLQTVLATTAAKDTLCLTTAITKSFEVVSTVDSQLGQAVTCFIMDQRRSFLATEECKGLMRQFPIFGTEVALSACKILPYLKDMLPAYCQRCRQTRLYNFEGCIAGNSVKKMCMKCNYEGNVTMPLADT